MSKKYKKSPREATLQVEGPAKAIGLRKAKKIVGTHHEKSTWLGGPIVQSREVFHSQVAVLSDSGFSSNE